MWSWTEIWTHTSYQIHGIPSGVPCRLFTAKDVVNCNEKFDWLTSPLELVCAAGNLIDPVFRLVKRKMKTIWEHWYTELRTRAVEEWRRVNYLWLENQAEKKGNIAAADSIKWIKEDTPRTLLSSIIYLWIRGNNENYIKPIPGGQANSS